MLLTSVGKISFNIEKYFKLSIETFKALFKCAGYNVSPINEISFKKEMKENSQKNHQSNSLIKKAEYNTLKIKPPNKTVQLINVGTQINATNHQNANGSIDQSLMKTTKISQIQEQNKHLPNLKTKQSSITSNNDKTTKESTQIHIQIGQNKLSQDSNKDLQVSSSIRSKIRQIGQIKNDFIIVTSYLRSILFDDNTNSKIKQFEIPNKSSQTGTIGDFIQSIIVLQKKISILSYSIIKNDDYIVQYYDGNELIKKLPKFINIQIKPATNTNFRIFVLCDSLQLNSNFEINENCFQIAILYQNKNIDDIKNRIIEYLLLPSSFEKPSIYMFKKNSFIQISSVDEIETIHKPIFAAWEHSIFIQINNYITSHMIKDHI